MLLLLPHNVEKAVIKISIRLKSFVKYGTRKLRIFKLGTYLNYNLLAQRKRKLLEICSHLKVEVLTMQQNAENLVQKQGINRDIGICKHLCESFSKAELSGMT